MREGLLWLRDRLASMPVTPRRAARHRRGPGAPLRPHAAAVRGERVAVARRDARRAGGGARERGVFVRIGAEGASAKIVKKMDVLYKPHAAAFSLLMWYKQDASDPAQYVNSNRRGA